MPRGTIILACFLLLFWISSSQIAKSQDQSASADQSASNNAVEGTVVSSTRNTFTVRTDDGKYQLFTFERGATRPRSLVRGVRVRVTAGPAQDNGTRAATDVAVLSGGTTGPSDKSAQAAPIPDQVRNVESEIKRESRRWRLGVEAGQAFNPELFMFGVQSQMGPIFHPRVQFRPNAEFDFGEVTDLVALNLEAVYRFSATYHRDWTPFAGAGPALIFIHQGFDAGRDISFGNFDYETGFNVLVGMQSRRGMFAELKTSLYSGPAPRLRLIFGYTF